MDESLLLRYPDLERNHFWWRVRREVIGKIIADLGNLRDLEILDVGCGSGMFAARLSEDGASVVGVDLELVDVVQSPIGPRLVHGDYLRISENLGEFDVALALDVVEHFENEQAIISALLANVKPGGHVVVTVPSYTWLWSSHDDQNHHYRRYTTSRLNRAIEEGGFVVERSGYLFLGLIIPKALLALLDRVTDEPPSTAFDPPGLLNQLAFSYFKVESWFAGRMPSFLPAGTSVVTIASKPV